MRAVRTELRAATAGEQRIAAPDRPREPLDAHPPAILGDEIPARERQRIEIVDRLAGHDARRNKPLSESHDARFGLAVEDEVAVIDEQFGHFRRGDADEPHLDAAGAHPIGPRGFVLVIDERGQDERHVAGHQIVARPLHIVAGTRQDGREVRHVHARHVVKLLLQVRGHGRHARKRIETRSVAAHDGVFADEAAVRFQVCENNSHRVTSM
jgi:hypothetical protein